MSEIAEFDHRHALEVVTFADYTDEGYASLAGGLIVTYGVTEEDHRLGWVRCSDGAQCVGLGCRATVYAREVMAQRPTTDLVLNLGFRRR